MEPLTIDKICGMTTNPTMLNALHACREGHPWNKPENMPWQNAYCVAAAMYTLPMYAVNWIAERAAAEKERGLRAMASTA